MDLRKRLAGLDRLTRKNTKDGAGPDTQRPDVVQPPDNDCLARLGLQADNSGSETLWYRDTRDPLPHPIAAWESLQGFFTRAQEANPALEKILFLDTETTGLSGGTGTLAFLVGVGWIKEGVFHSRQYFLPDFSGEGTMLEALGNLARDFEVVMTFNGASFDLPLLRTRALMNRQVDPCAKLVSWDLLVPGRRLWRRSLPNCRQQTLEEHLLHWKRGSDDIDGALIPQTWFDFLGTGDGSDMARVLHHNQKDLLGMAGIFAHVLDMVKVLKENEAGSPTPEDFALTWSLARIAEGIKEQTLAADWIERALAGVDQASEAVYGDARFVSDALRLLKRKNRNHRVLQVLEMALAEGLDEPWVHREAAILFEHRLVRLDRALHHGRLCGESGRTERLERKIKLAGGE